MNVVPFLIAVRLGNNQLSFFVNCLMKYETNDIKIIIYIIIIIIFFNNITKVGRESEIEK